MMKFGSQEPPRLGAPGARVERAPAPEAPPEREAPEQSSAPRPTPESVGYHGGNETCQSCSFFGEGGDCSFLAMPVDPAGHCARYEGGSEDAGVVDHDAGGMELEGEEA